MATNKIDKPSKQFAEMRRSWELPDALIAGSSEMKSRRWLPPEPAETERNYEQRLRRSHLFNAYKKTVQQNVGKVFSREIQPSEDMHPLLRLMMDNVDMEGRDANTFAKSVFEDGIVRGISAIFVDYTAQQAAETRADEVNERPYWVHLTADQLLDVRSSLVNGRQRPTYLRFQETVVEYTDEYTQEEVAQVKTFSMREDGVIEWFAYQKRKSSDVTGNSHYTWELADGGELYNMPYVPVVPFYAERTGFFAGRPPLNELAETNLAHFRSMSDQRNILHIARVPMLKFRGDSGIDPETGKQRRVVISPNTVIDLGNDPNADAQWIEHDGKAIESGRKDLQDLEDQMAVQGLDLTAHRPGTQTATEKSIDTAAANSQLKSMALNLESALEQAINLAGVYLEIPENQAGTLRVNTDFTVSYSGESDMKNLFEMYRSGLINATTLIDEAKRRSVLHPDAEMLEQEPQANDTVMSTTQEATNVDTSNETS